MSKYVATLTKDRGEVQARNLFELQSTLCTKLNVPDSLLTYHLLRSAALDRLKDRNLNMLLFLGIQDVRKTYKSVAGID